MIDETSGGHIVKAYDDELSHLTSIIAEMGGLAERQLAAAIDAMLKRDSDAAKLVMDQDKAVDELEHEVDNFAVRLLALRQPMARDLREIIVALKTSSDLERIADYAKNVAKRTIALNQAPPVKTVYALPRMAALVQAMIKDTLDAYVHKDADKAGEVWRRDEEVDALYNSLFRELLTYMMEDPRNITTCTHLLFIAKNIERMGDHTTNVAENVHYVVHGVPLSDDRPKGDMTAFEVMEPKAED